MCEGEVLAVTAVLCESGAACWAGTPLFPGCMEDRNGLPEGDGGISCGTGKNNVTLPLLPKG